MKSIFHRIFIDGFNGMAKGYFATFIMGTIICQLGSMIGGTVGYYMISIGNVARALTGAGIGAGIAAMYSEGVLVSVCASVVGMIGAFPRLGMDAFAIGNAGEPLGAFIAAIVAVELGHLVAGKTKADLFVTPVVGIGTGALAAYFVGPYIAKLMHWIGTLINYNVAQSPIIGGVIVAVLMGMLITLPLSSLAVALSLGLSGVAAGAAVVGCCCNMIGFAVTSYKENKVSGLFKLGIGTSMLQFSNILRHPQIWVPEILASAILGPISAALLHMSSTSTGAGMGSIALIGQLDTWNVMTSYMSMGVVALEILLMHFILPGVICLAVSEVMRKLGWIKNGYMRLDV